MAEVDVIVVGAGVSGLSAARLLEKHGMSVLVLEATDRVGGKTETWAPDNGHYGTCDTNSGYVTLWQSHAIRMCRELGLQLYQGTYDLYGVQYGTKRVDLHGDLKPMLWLRNPLAAWDLAVMIRRLEKMCWEVPEDKPWEAPHAKEWDQMTIRELYDKHCWTEDCYEYLHSISVMDVAESPSHTSLLFYLWYLRHAQGPCQAWAQEDGADAMKILGGAQEIPDGIAGELKGTIHFNQIVMKMCYGDNGVTVQTLDGNKYESKYAILAIPPATQLRVHFDPPLPMMRNCLLQRSPHGLVMVGIVFYREPFWESNGFSGFATCSDEKQIVRLVFEDYQERADYYNLTCFSFAETMNKVTAMSEEEMKDAICQCLAKFYNSDRALKPDHFVSKLWSDEQYSCGGYATTFLPGTLTMFGPALRAPLGDRIFMAGVETATHWIGFMSGAIDAGQRAAREVLHADGRIKKNEVLIQEPSLRYQFSIMEEMLPTIETMLITVCGIFFSLGATLVVHCFF